MSLGALYPGRVSNAMMMDRFRANIRTAQQTMSQLQDQLSTNQRFNIPSQDPAAASRTLMLQRLLASKEQYQINLRTDQSVLSAADANLAGVSDALNQARQMITAGIGNSSSPAEKQTLANQASALVKQLLSAANSQFNGKYNFSGSDNSQPPFTLRSDGSIQYNGDQVQIQSQVDSGQWIDTNLDGNEAFGALTAAIGTDNNPALTLATSLNDLYGGTGSPLKSISITLSSVGTPQTVDLSGAKTIGDVKTIIENELGASNITVSLNASNNGLLLTPATGTVSVANAGNENSAARLGIVGSGATISGSDLDPRLTNSSLLADLNGGTGIGSLSGTGLLITNGGSSQVVDLSGAVTVEDLLNKLRDTALGLSVGINAEGTGITIASRLSGSNFSIGENGGSTATLLGVRTFTANTVLRDLNFSRGVPVNGGNTLNITRHDGSVVNVDLSGAGTVQDVLDKITASAAGLTASLNSVGNGISIADASTGSTALAVEQNDVADALGLTGSQSNSSLPLTGREPNPQEAPGVFNLLIRLQSALQQGDNAELQRLSPLLDKEVTRVTQTRGELGIRLHLVDSIQNRLDDDQLQLKSDLSDTFDTDITTVVTQLTAMQNAMEATYRAASLSFGLSLANYL